MLATTTTLALEGVGARPVKVEADVRRGLPTFTLVGLGDRAVREARERVRAAVQNSGLEFPMKRLTVNLAPAHVRKAGASFDLAIAAGLLAASEQVPPEALEGCALCGELSLTGELRPVRGAVALAVGARAAGCTRLVVPPGVAPEAALAGGIEVLAVPTLRRMAELFRGEWQPAPAEAPDPPEDFAESRLDLADVRGQEDAKRALEIAAAGGHNLLMIGPPGAGKTMLARRLPGILPPPTLEEALEITSIHSVAGLGTGRLAAERPFRAPHHTISPQGLVGGGAVPRPGEVTLAHRGVLFLDELGEFTRVALDALRQPLEDGRVDVTRGQRTLRFPAKTMLVAACNDCPCGRPGRECRCDDTAKRRYARRLSGPLVDRIDLVCQVEAVPSAVLLDAAPGRAGSESARVRSRVLAARERQERRLANTAALCNAEMDPRATRAAAGDVLAARLAATTGVEMLSGRGHDRVLRVARTIADLEGAAAVSTEHVDEALGYRLNAWELAAA